jgi:hypothetical protein
MSPPDPTVRPPFSKDTLMTRPAYSFALATLNLTALALLTACGGGGGGGSGSTDAPPTVADVVPGAGMSWSTVATPALTVSVMQADGSTPVAGAAVRFFTLSRKSPQDGSTLAAPVPVNLLETAVTDAQGQARVAVRLPADQTELLVVATEADTRASGALDINQGSPGLALVLKR